MHLRVEPAGVRAPPLQVARVVGGVGDRQEALGAQAVGEEVVEHPPVLAAEHAVLRAAHRDRGDVVGEQPLQQRLSAGADGFELAHVRDVEDPAAPAHRQVLGAHAGVLHGHLPARELDQLRAGGDVAVVQGGAAHPPQASGASPQERRHVDVVVGDLQRRALALADARAAVHRAAGALAPRVFPIPPTRWSKPVPITVTRTSSPRLSSMTAPKMMLASGSAAFWMISAASLTSNRPRSCRR